jgi:exopolysaccharide biosynthesis polyprenyl glycosylphosphotransferase
MKRGEVTLTVLRVPLDYLLLVGAGLFVYLLRVRILDAWRPVLFGPELPLAKYSVLLMVVSVVVVLVYAASGLYDMKRRRGRGEEFARITVATSAAMLVVILVMFLRAELFNSRFLVVGYWLAAILFVTIGRALWRLLLRTLLARTGIGANRVLLIGNDAVTDRIAQAVADDPGLGYRIVRRLTDPDLGEVIAATSGPGIDEILLANPDYPADRVVMLVDFCHENHITFTFVPNIYQTLTTHWDVNAIGSLPVVQLRRTALDGWGKVFKRTFDIAFAVLALVVLSPVLAVIAFAVKWETAGPVLVRLARMSRNREFMLFKFRSMIENAEELKPLLASSNERADGPLFKVREDPRVTRVGRILRKYRLDELPQFLNVLWGDISVVGPRPHQPDEIARYAKHHRKVLAIKAGATGLAQVSGSSDLPFEDEVALDTFYIENWSLWLDLRVIVRTVARMLTDRSAV